jgi:hypothetical protein
VWLDRDEIRPGDRFVDVLERALASVQCVVVVVSPGSMLSRWVQDEYHRALAFSNTPQGDRRLIAILIDDVEPPGFLANRDWVDFRDHTRYERAIDDLVFGITGRRAGGTGGASTSAVRDEPPAQTGTRFDEVDLLGRAIARTRAEADRVRQARKLAAVPGLGLSALMALTSGSSALVLASLVVAGPAVTVLVALGVTTPSMSRCNRKLEQFELLRDGLEACRARSIPGCHRLRETFWSMMERQTSELAAPTRAS